MLNLVQVQEKLKGMPTQALMQYANGTNPQVPPFLALGELNRRKKMQEGAAAEQAAEMEGAPTVKQQIEQAAGLMALQGARQKQAAQQQAGIQAAMPMAAPNTTTSEPAQLAGGGFINDIVVPRDYQAGGVAGLDPVALKKLALIRAMKNQPRRAGLPSVPVNMFRRGDYASGGIVAFAGPEGSFVETRPGFYELESEVMGENVSAGAKDFFADLIRRRRQIRPIADLLREQGLLTPPDTGGEEIKALESQQRRLGEADTLARRVMSLDPLRIGRSMADYMTKQETSQTDIESKLAKAKDLKAKAAYDMARGNIEKAQAEMIAAVKEEGDIGKAMFDAQKGRELTNAAKTIFDEAQAAGMPITMEEAYRRATLATTRPPDRYTALSNRLIAANREFKDRAFFLEQQLQNAKTDAERARIQNAINNLRTEIMSSHSISPADLAELQRLDRSSGGAGGTSGGSSAGQSDPLGIRNR
jgi:hypothetical protein